MTPAERLEYITKEMALHASDGHWLAESRLELSSLYSYFSGQLEQILFCKPKVWLTIRENTKSDSSAEKQWQQTEDGQKETIYRYRLKRIEKMMSSMRTMIQILSDESRNQM